jgi:hypothetical protein
VFDIATPFVTIYDRAISSFNDPILMNTYNQNKIQFLEVMFGYLSNAIPAFRIPMSVLSKLEDRTDPAVVSEYFSGTGTEDEFALTAPYDDNNYYDVFVSGVQVPFSYEETGNKVVVDTPPASGTDNVEVVIYTDGEFHTTLNDTEQRILSALLVLSWAEKEKNFLLDIRRLVNDKDFKMYSESGSMRDKGNWYASLREETEKMMLNYSWRRHMTTISENNSIPFV